MLSDDSSSDSETGRFKCKSKPEEVKKLEQKQESRSSTRSRRSENDRFNRRRDDRDHFDRSRDRFRHSRYSPANRRRRSRDGSPIRRRSHERRNSHDRNLTRRSHERHRVDRNSATKPKIREHRSSSKDRHSRSRSNLRNVDHRRDVKEEVKHSREITPNKFNRKTRESRESISLSPDPKGKKSEIYKPPAAMKRKSDSPVIVVEEAQPSSDSEEVQPGSYYNMIPAVVKEKSEESSEIDSSDDEKLRAKLLNLERKLSKTKKKKHRKKHKRKSSKSKERENDSSLSVEVSSTTDIKGRNLESPKAEPVPEVTSTQKTTSKESSEEGEIQSDDDSQKESDIDPSDLRHKLKRSRIAGTDEKNDVCGPALPPHLQGRFEKKSLDIEGPVLPPRLQSGPRSIGPSIPDDMRKILAEKERDVIKYESSDDDHNIGPLPEGAEGKWSDAHKRLEQRAMAMKIRQLEGHGVQSSEVKSREKWMLELPQAKAKYLGLEARTFRAKEGPDMSDRSSWTDTPEDKAKKAAGQVNEDPDIVMKREAKARQIANRDDEQEEAVKKHKKKHKREESLLELHQKKQKKKKKKEEKEDGKKERRPFNREVDMQVNRFDEAQKRSIIKKAQDLDGRFSKGEAKYL